MTIPAPDREPEQDQDLDPEDEAGRRDSEHGMDVPAERVDRDDPTGAPPQP